MYRPTMSRTFSISRGSVDSLNVSVRCGCNPNARQICCTVVRPNPLAFAMPRLLQCVSPRGVSSSVRTITVSICSSLICRGAPRSRLVVQPVEPLAHEPAAPFAHGGLRHPQPLRDRGVVVALGTRQND